MNCYSRIGRTTANGYENYWNNRRFSGTISSRLFHTDLLFREHLDRRNQLFGEPIPCHSNLRVIFEASNFCHILETQNIISQAVLLSFPLRKALFPFMKARFKLIIVLS